MTPVLLRDAWDAVVIGAGPAGSVAARELARRGKRVLLLDKASFPRGKVCGCCLNASAIGVLERVGLGAVVKRLGARGVEGVELVSARGRRAWLELGGGVSVSRAALDAALAEAAVKAGVEFVQEGAAGVGPVEGDFRIVRVRDSMVRARVVIVADGLAGTSLKEVPGFEPVVRPDSRVGIGCAVSGGPFARGAITMVCGRRGYVGAVWLEDERIDIAGAVDAVWMKEVGGPGAAVGQIFAEAGVRVDQIVGAAWRGTPGLTRRRRLEGERLLVIGDAAGYVEPFTGEGMAWAMMSGEAAAGVVENGASWARVHRSLIGHHQRECRWVARLLRNPGLCAMAIGVLGAAPGLAAPIVRRIGVGQSRPNLEITTS